MALHPTLSKRGSELAGVPSFREPFGAMMADLYDPEHNPTGTVNLGVSENFMQLPEIAEFVNKNVKFQAEAFSYGEGPWGSARLRNGMARFINANFDVLHPIDADDILFANGVTSICEMLGYTICDPGDGVLLSRPIYQSFQIDFGIRAKCVPVFTDFGSVDGFDQFSPEAVSKYEEAILKAEKDGVKVKTMVLCNPHNPLGQCYPKDAIIAMMKMCQKHSIHLLSDEIYATSVYDTPDKEAVKFTSVLSFDTSEYIDPNYLHVIYGLSKDFGASGIRLGCIYMRNKELMRAMSAITQFHWSGGPNQEIAATMLEDEKWPAGFVQAGRDRLAARSKLVRELLDEAGIKYHRGANAGFFIWIDLRPFLRRSEEFKTGWEAEAALGEKLRKNKVFMVDGQSLSSLEPGFFRIIFSQEEATLREGMKRVCEAIGSKRVRGGRGRDEERLGIRTKKRQEESGTHAS